LVKAPANTCWSNPVGAVPEVANWYRAARKMPFVFLGELLPSPPDFG